MAKLACAVVCLSLLVAIGSLSAQGLVPDCTLPFASLAKHHSIDDNCDARGQNNPDDPVDNVGAQALQNLAKNNFCATGTPALVTFISFKKLQQRLYQKAPEAKTWGRKHLPKDRGLFRDIYTTSENVTIGEGTLVTFAGWLMRPKDADFESCNCGKPDNAAIEKTEVIDIHLVMISSSDREHVGVHKRYRRNLSTLPTRQVG